MKQLQLYPFNGQAVDVVHGFQQIFFCFSRKSHNDMSHHRNIMGGKAFYSVGENVVVISPPDEMGRGFLCRLQPQFHPKFCFAVQLRQQLDYIISQTVRTCGNGKPHNVRLGQGFFVFLPQGIHRGVCIGECLKIGDVPGMVPLGRSLGFPLCDLLLDGKGGTFGKITGAACGTEQTAAGADGAVTVGAGETAVQ